jgi:EmrB/QacA subfamily drug resistance transporter
VTNLRIVPWIVAVAFFMEGLDGTVITTALPAMAHDLGTSAVILSSGISAYLVSLAVFIPLGGWIADRYGESTAFRIALLTFTAASVACAFAGTPDAFIAARIVQGAGGAMMVPVGRLIILRSFEKSQFVQAMSMVTTPALVGPLLGPLLGGFLTTYFNWRWIFWINVPMGIAGIVLATLWIRNTRSAAPTRFDVLGFVLTAGSVSFGMTGIELLTRNDVPRAAVAALLIAGAATGAVAVRHALRTSAPLLDLRLFRISTFRASNGLGIVFRAMVMATPFLLPLLFQVGFGLTAFVSGLLTFVAAIGAISMKRAAPFILKRYGFRRVLAVNGTICGVATLSFAFTDGSALALIVLAVLAFGFTRSLQLASLNALQFSNVTAAQHGPAASLSSTLQQIASAVGVAAAAVTLHALAQMHASQHGAFDLHDIRITFLCVGVTTILSALYFFSLHREAGAEFSGYRDSLQGRASQRA